MNDVFKASGSPIECSWKAVVITLLNKGWSFSIDFDDENNHVYIDYKTKRMTFEL